jgi:hypothetical protein
MGSFPFAEEMNMGGRADYGRAEIDAGTAAA